MAEGTDNVEDRISCDDSSYSKRNLEVYESGDGVNCGSEDEDLLEPIGRLCDSASCSY